ncbi:hypothetical protein [Actibacterium sp. 188UL27-1]|uniref:hypothetical protein n=1 Tax=Actibacterium sp. 188UL27-1 TaxID=2786961 RepID=UPI00195D5599|nr:hypothetical protein [Actibacterium sp. 188UL27-1]MBM7067166.1 hypothetical protein [Actibacterium sp. 188UL27-1]
MHTYGPVAEAKVRASGGPTLRLTVGAASELNLNPSTSNRLENLLNLTKLVAARSSANRPFRRAIGTRRSDLEIIAQTLQTGPDSWRMSRAFHTVHVSSLIAVMAMLEQIDNMTSVSADKMRQVLASLH